MSALKARSARKMAGKWNRGRRTGARRKIVHGASEWIEKVARPRRRQPPTFPFTNMNPSPHPATSASLCHSSVSIHTLLPHGVATQLAMPDWKVGTLSSCYGQRNPFLPFSLFPFLYRPIFSSLLIFFPFPSRLWHRRELKLVDFGELGELFFLNSNKHTFCSYDCIFVNHANFKVESSGLRDQQSNVYHEFR